MTESSGPSSSDTLGIGQIVEQYRVVRRIGAGCMAEVFEAEHLRLGSASRAAIKVLSPRWQDDAQVSARFFNEARAASLIDHPGVVRILSFGTTETGLPYLIMEYLNGQPLRAHLPDEPVSAPLRWLRLLRQIAATMAAVHQVGIVHRDLKPDNVLVIADPEVAGGERTKVVDFGLARLRPEHYGADRTVVQTSQGHVMGTPHFMSPEQCGGAQEVDGKSDVYALGAIAYRMLSGTHLFNDKTVTMLLHSQLFSKPVPLAERCPRLDPELVRLIDSMIEKIPRQRPTMQEVADQLARWTQPDRAAARPRASSLRGLLRRWFGAA